MNDSEETTYSNRVVYVWCRNWGCYDARVNHIYLFEIMKLMLLVLKWLMIRSDKSLKGSGVELANAQKSFLNLFQPTKAKSLLSRLTENKMVSIDLFVLDIYSKDFPNTPKRVSPTKGWRTKRLGWCLYHSQPY